MHIGNVVESAFLLQHRLPPWDWLPDVADGYGGPNYLYYNHLGFFVPACFVLAGLTPITAIKVWLLLTLTLAVISAFIWCSSLGGRLLGLAGACLYVWGPYYYTLPYVRGSYPELCSISLYPLLFFLTQKYLQLGGTVRLLLCVIVFTAILCIHTLSLILVCPVLLIYLVLYQFVVLGRVHIGRIALVFSLTLLVSGPFLHYPLFRKNEVDISNQFQTAELYTSMGLPWYSLLNARPMAANMTSYFVPGRVHFLALCFAILLSRKLLSHRRANIVIHIAIACFALLMTLNPFAGHIVAILSPLRYLQFPWRFLGIFNLFVCSAFVTAGTCFRSTLVRSALVAIVAGLCLFMYSNNIPYQRNSKFITSTREGIKQSRTTLDQEGKYRPVGARTAVPASDMLEVVDGVAKTWKVRTDLNNYVFKVSATTPSVLRFAQYWFPDWQLEVDDSKQVLARDRENGLCRLELTTGTHLVHVYFLDSKARRIEKCISMLTIILMIATCVVRRKVKRNAKVNGSLTVYLEPTTPDPRRYGSLQKICHIR
jgi:hypothetical protein